MSGLEGGRQVPTPSMNHMAQSHEALKAMTDAASPARSQAVADEWAAMASGFDEAAGLFQQAMASSEAGWTGAAAEGMRAQLARVAKWSKETGAHCGAASAAITGQSGVSDSAKSSMPPPVPYDPAQMIKDARAGGNVSDLAALPFRMYAQKQKHDAAHEEAARIVSERDQAFTEAAGAIPEFVPPPSLGDQGSADAVERTAETAGTPPAAVPHPGQPPAFAPGAGFGPGGFGPAGPAAAPLPVAASVPMATPGRTKDGGKQKRPEYLVEPELQGMFGSDELTSPPVIGEG